MPKSVSVYLDDRDVEALDNLARNERRSRSAMVSELIRRYLQFTQAGDLEEHPLFRPLSSRQLDEFLNEDRVIPPGELTAYRKLLGLS